MATSLYSDEVRSISQATERFTSEPGLVLLRPRHRPLCSPLHFTIPSGCYALVSRHGADQEYVRSDGTRSIVWPPGLHFGYPPWVRVSHLVTMQTIVLDLPVKACKTKDNVTVNIDVALAFRIMGDQEAGEDPEFVRKFVHELKPRGLEQQLRDAQDEAVRGLARSLKHTEIYGIRSGEHTRFVKSALGSVTVSSVVNVESSHDDLEGANVADSTTLPTHRDETLVGESDDQDRNAAKIATAKGADVTEYMKQRLNRQFMPQGVEILSIMIQSCTLPKEIESQMEEKTKVISKNAQQRMFHQNNMQNTRMEEEIVTLMQTFEELRHQEESSGAEQITEEKVKLNDAVAEAKKSEATIIQEGIARIDKLKAESDLEVQRIISRKDQTIATMKAESQREAANLHAKTKLEVERKIAEASIIAAKNRAQASRLLAQAEGISAPMLAQKNEHITKLKQLDVYRNLANNNSLILCDSDDSDVNVIVIADSILADSESSKHLSRSSVLAELSLLNRLSKGMFDQSYRSNTPTVDGAVNGHS
ncbi:hypothetical protein HJC23_000442 [Cyclotella cryptica]|uniref:Band 7 domain-containing protein n=1 Tax=Cyclotella cryptica TaxID=29204 RepID=A0ABD3QAP9_9STRA|eukprot:CCRYP_007178-RA/>CCRYP_007178-RA protein AED:0.03 eAED:0.03 QI:216/1/1/1/1/1/3/530/534